MTLFSSTRTFFVPRTFAIQMEGHSEAQYPFFLMFLGPRCFNWKHKFDTHKNWPKKGKKNCPLCFLFCYSCTVLMFFSPTLILWRTVPFLVHEELSYIFFGRTIFHFFLEELSYIFWLNKSKTYWISSFCHLDQEYPNPVYWSQTHMVVVTHTSPNYYPHPSFLFY